MTISCRHCANFRSTGVDSFGNPYAWGGTCDCKPPSEMQGNYCNGGCAACDDFKCSYEGAMMIVDETRKECGDESTKQEDAGTERA